MIKSRRPYITFVSVSLLLVTIYLFYTSHVGNTAPYSLCRNVSDSMPWTWFLTSKFQKVERGMYVAFQHPLSEIKLAKQIIGLPGDTIYRRNDRMYVNDVDCGVALRISRSGRMMRPMTEGIIPAGFVFVSSPHPEGFDSRYEAFGLVSIESLEEVLWPLI